MRVLDQADKQLEDYGVEVQDSPVCKPDLVVCLNPKENWVMLRECGWHNVPTIGVVDTDADPTWVTYPVPANDDSLRCVSVIAGVLGRAAQDGKKERMRQVKEGKFMYARTGLKSDTEKRIAVWQKTTQ